MAQESRAEKAAVENRIFNPGKRRILRSHVSMAEIVSGAAVVLSLAVTVLWIAAQQDNFNPAERDLPYEMLAAQPAGDRLYRTPLVGWVEPGRSAAGGAAAGQVDMGLIPVEILSGGWAISSRPRRFDRETLFEKINGEAEKFIRQNFRALHFVAIKNAATGDELAI